MQQPWINGGMRVKIQQIKDLLDKLPLTSSVVDHPAADLAKELFTHKGSGTLVRRGEKVLRATEWGQLDCPAAHADRIQLRPHSGAGIFRKDGCCAPMSARTIAPR